MAASKHKTRAFFYSYFKRMWRLPVLDAELVWILQKSGRRWSTVLWYGKCTYSERNDIDTEQLIFVSPKLKEKKRKKKKQLKKSAYTGSRSRYTWTAEVRSTTELCQRQVQSAKKINILISINYKTSDNSAGSSLYESFLLVNLGPIIKCLLTSMLWWVDTCQRYSQTSNMWPFRGLRFIAHWGHVIFKIACWSSTCFRWDRGFMEYKSCVLITAVLFWNWVNAIWGLTVSRSINLSSMQMCFTALESGLLV